MQSKSSLLSIPKIALIDIFILSLAYFIPAMSHIFPIPLYYLDPMRIFVLTGYFLSKNKVNGYVLAASVPLFSMWMTGHPIFVKSFLILLELSANLYFFHHLKSHFNRNIFIALWISIMLSKIIYYLMKYFCIQFLLIEGQLISTPIFIQILTISFVSLIMFLLNKTKIFSID